MRVGWTLLALSCGQEGMVTNLLPELSVLPGSVAFGEVVAGTAAEPVLLFVSNLGLANLDAALSIEGDEEGAFVLPADLHVVLAPDSGAEISIGFVPPALEPYDADLVVTWNHPDEPVRRVPLSGFGRVPYAPEIEVAPLALDLGTVDVDSAASGVVTVANVGDADLVLGTLTQSGAGTFTLSSDPSGVAIAPAESRAILVSYAALHDAGDSGALTIPSNDADEPTVEVAFLANGGGEGPYPEAIVDCPGGVELHGPVVVHLDGGASFDPDGGALTYRWAVARRPDGAHPVIAPEPADAVETDLLVDAAGTWEVTLVVTTAAGVPSVPAKCVLEVVPTAEMYVELSWAGATSDLDLHLAEDGGALFAVPSDVSWCNPAPDWGVAGEISDDPELTLDDAEGFGPEQIALPEPAGGSYSVRVHAFDDADDGAVTATVQIFVHGMLAHVASEVLERNQVWDVATVVFPDGTVAVVPSVWDAGGSRGCP